MPNLKWLRATMLAFCLVLISGLSFAQEVVVVPDATGVTITVTIRIDFVQPDPPAEPDPEPEPEPDPPADPEPDPEPDPLGPPAEYPAEARFVDYESGDDSNNGLSPETAWKHAPWDANATGVSDAATLAPGSELVFKGGVRYPGSLLAADDGAPGSPIILDGNTRGAWGTGKAVLDGSELISGWVDSGGGLWSATLPTGAGDVWEANLYEGSQILRVSQGPNNPSDPWEFDYLSELRAVPPSQATTTSITDPEIFSSQPAGWTMGGWVAIWCGANQIYMSPITSDSGDTITFDPVGAIYPDRDTRYAIMNVAAFQDLPGEYVVNGATVSLKSAVEPSGITASVRRVGIEIWGHDYLTIRGFSIVKYSSTDDTPNKGVSIISSTTTGPEGLIIEDCELAYNRSMDKAAAITVKGNSSNHISGPTIQRNHVHHNFRSRGIVVSYADDCVIDSNHLQHNSGTGIFVQISDRCRISNNVVERNRGVHSNGISLYTDCPDGVIEGNRVVDGLHAITVKGCDDLIVRNNVLDCEDNVDPAAYTFADWGGSTNTLFENNTVLSPFDKAVFLGSPSTVRNSVLEGLHRGSGASDAQLVHEYNIFLAWSSQYGESSLGTGEFFSTVDLLYADADVLDFTPAPGSPAIGAGLNGVDIGASVP